MPAWCGNWRSVPDVRRRRRGIVVIALIFAVSTESMPTPYSVLNT